MKPIATYVCLAAVSLFSASAFAQATAPAEEPAPQHRHQPSGAFVQETTPAASPLAFNISLASNYKFRGQDQDQSKTGGFKPALQGGVDYAFANGFYVGNWNSTIN